MDHEQHRVWAFLTDAATQILAAQLLTICSAHGHIDDETNRNITNSLCELWAAINRINPPKY